MLPLANANLSHMNNLPSAANSTRDPAPPAGGLPPSRRMVAKYYSSLRKSHNQLVASKGRGVDNHTSNMIATGTPMFSSESMSFARPVSEPRLHTQPYPPVSQLSGNLTYSSSESHFSSSRGSNQIDSSQSSNQMQMNSQDFNQYQVMPNFHDEFYLNSFADPTNFEHIIANQAYQPLPDMPPSQQVAPHQHGAPPIEASSQSSRSSSIGHEDDDHESGQSKMQFVVSTTDSVATELYLDEILPKKKRAKTTAEQLQYLREAFEQDHLPTAEARQAIAEKINMTPQAVRIWFQNARAKVRNETLKAGKTQSAFIDASKSSPPPQIPIQTFELFTKSSKQSSKTSSQSSQSHSNSMGVPMTFDAKNTNQSEASISQFSISSSLPTPPQSFTNVQGSLTSSLTPAQSYTNSQGNLNSSLPTPPQSYTSSQGSLTSSLTTPAQSYTNKVFPNVASTQQLSLLRDSSLATSLPFASSLYSNYDHRDNGRGSQAPLHFPVEGWDVAKQQAAWGYNLDFSAPAPAVDNFSNQGVDRPVLLPPQRVGGDTVPRSPSSLPLPSLLPGDPALGPLSVDNFLLESLSSSTGSKSSSSEAGLHHSSGMTHLTQPLPPLLGTTTTATSVPLMVDATSSLLGLCQPLMASLYSFPEMFSNISNNQTKATHGPKLVNGYLQN